MLCPSSCTESGCNARRCSSRLGPQGNKRTAQFLTLRAWLADSVTELGTWSQPPDFLLVEKNQPLLCFKVPVIEFSVTCFKMQPLINPDTEQDLG